MTIVLISLKLNKFTRFFFLGVGAAYLKGPRAALVLNPALRGHTVLSGRARGVYVAHVI
jgi:hypothetical protein